MKTLNQLSVSPLLFLLAVAAGCGSGEDKPVATQVAAKVDAAEITVYQVNNVLSRTPNVTPEVEPRVKREILDNLIDRQVARQLAIENKLDRSPEVLQALESAKTEILARAYLAKIAAAQAKPTPTEVKAYYDEHPALFTQRRIYSVEEIALPAQPGLAQTLREQASRARSLQEIGASLKQRGIRFTANGGVRTAEQLPFEYLEKLPAMKPGEIQVLELRGGIQVLHLVASRLAPVDEATARPRIQQFLSSQRSTTAITDEMKQAKAKAKIEYIGEFAIPAAEAEAKASLLLEASAKAEAEEKARQEAETSAQAQARAAAAREAQERSDARAKARAEAEQARRETETNAPSGAQRDLPQKTLEKGVRGL